MFIFLTLAACTATVVNPSSNPAKALSQTTLPATSTTASHADSTIPTRESCGCTPKPALTLIGLVDREESWNLQDLRSIGFDKFNITIPNGGSQFFDGLHLNTLLNKAHPLAQAKILSIVSGDGTSVDVDLQTVRACTGCLVVLYGDSRGPTTLRTVMPGFPDNTWVKAVKKLVVK